MHPIHAVFTTSYNGIAKELVSEVDVIDPISNSSVRVERAIWDTGATGSVITKGLVDKLGLVPTGQAQVHTANGSAVVNTYLIHIGLPHSRVLVQQLNVTEGKLGPNTEMLVGMDVIRHGDFIVENNGGKTRFSFCYPPFQNKYDMIEKANKINAKNAKKNAKLVPKL